MRANSVIQILGFILIVCAKAQPVQIPKNTHEAQAAGKNPITATHKIYSKLVF